MKVIVVEPYEVPYLMEISDHPMKQLSELQKLVGGWIEVVRPFNDNVILICDEEGKLKGKPANRQVNNDIIAGIFVLTGCNGQDFIQLTDEQLQKYGYIFNSMVIKAEYIK